MIKGKFNFKYMFQNKKTNTLMDEGKTSSFTLNASIFDLHVVSVSGMCRLRCPGNESIVSKSDVVFELFGGGVTIRCG